MRPHNRAVRSVYLCSLIPRPSGALAMTRAAALALGFLITPPVFDGIDAITNAVTLRVMAEIGNPGFIAHAQAQLHPARSDALGTYTKSVNEFTSILKERRAQIDSHQQLPNLPGQALYLARNNMMSAYKDLTDALAAKIGRSNKFGIPPAYLDADNEPLLDEYINLFNIMEAPPLDAQHSSTPFQDVVDLGTVIGRVKGLGGANAELAGRISLG